MTNQYKTFKFFTNTLKAIKEGNTRYITGIASSTSIDRENDRMSESALHTMKATAEANLTIFTNHEYKVPDDLFGSCTEATVKAQKDKEPIVIKSTDGSIEITTFTPQEFEVKIKVVSDEVNPKAGQLYKAIEEGVNLGFSIGGVVKSAQKVLDAATEKVFNLIESIDLYEISVVGIPANADAMNLAIAKSLHAEKDADVAPANIDDLVAKYKKNEPEYTLEGVNTFLKSYLKKYYDDCYDEWCEPSLTPAEKEAEEEKREKEDMQYAKAWAENVLMAAGYDAKMADTDDHIIHLRSHSSDMEMQMTYYGKDITKFAEHIQKHLKAVQREINAEESENESMTE